MLIEETVKEIERMKKSGRPYTPDEVTRLSRFMPIRTGGVLDTPFSRMDFLQTRITANTPAGYFAIQEQTARNPHPRLAEMAEKILQYRMPVYRDSRQITSLLNETCT